MGCSPQTFSNVLQALQAPLMNHGALNFRIPFLFLCLLYLKYNRYNKDNYQNKQRSEKHLTSGIIPVQRVFLFALCNTLLNRCSEFVEQGDKRVVGERQIEGNHG